MFRRLRLHVQRFHLGGHAWNTSSSDGTHQGGLSRTIATHLKLAKQPEVFLCMMQTSLGLGGS